MFLWDLQSYVSKPRFGNDVQAILLDAKEKRVYIEGV